MKLSKTRVHPLYQGALLNHATNSIPQTFTTTSSFFINLFQQGLAPSYIQSQAITTIQILVSSALSAAGRLR
jgi:hypothetical protein